MNWLALSPVEIAAVWTTLAAAALWLYLHHRRPKHKRVSTLRFWASVQPVSQPRRRKLREPWAFFAQIVFLLLIVLALANPRLGPATDARSVALVFDTSIWSRARPAGQPAWIDRERAQALRLLDSLPADDRVLLLRAEPDAPPLLAFTTDRAAQKRAILEAQPSSVAADLPGALETGRAALGGARRALLAYVGPGFVDAEQSRALNDLRAELESPENNGDRPQVLMRLVGDPAPLQNRGITRLSLRRDAARPDLWHILTQLKNYSGEPSDATLAFTVNGHALGQRKITLGPDALVNAEYEIAWNQGGLLQAEISPADALQADDRAAVSIPAFRTVRAGVIAGTASPSAMELLRVLSSDPYVRAEILSRDAAASSPPDIAIYQGASLPPHVDFDSIFFLGGASPGDARPVRVTGWNAQHPVSRWVRTRDISVRNPATLQLQRGDTVLAYAEGDPPAPLIVAREQDGHRVLVVGFNPHDSNIPLESAFPLLMAGSIEWMTRSVDDVADSRSTGEIDWPTSVLKITGPSGKEVPFAREDSGAHFLALETGIYRVTAPGSETSIAVNPPALPSERVQLTAEETADADAEPLLPAAFGLWRWFVVLAIAALWAEWWLYYSSRERQRTAEIQEIPGDAPREDPYAEVEGREEPRFRSSNLVGR
jgi:Ca-activated chloride channel homolog